MVFSKWKGRNYVRVLVKPSNPKAAKQLSVRGMFKFLSQEWKPNCGDADKASWNDRADDLVVSPFNAFMGYNQARWRNFKAPTQYDPAEETGTLQVAAGYHATGGIRLATVGYNVSAINEGWGHLLFRSTETGFDTGFDNLIAVMSDIGAGDIAYVDSPLIAGTYYYNWRKFTFSGNLGDETGQATAVVTDA